MVSAPDSMKASVLHFCLILAPLVPVAVAETPRPPTLTRYSRLWTDSPFTSKPAGPASISPDNPLNDYVLGGASRLNDGYYVILLNKKKPEEKKVIRPGSSSEFEILAVNWSSTAWKDTTVTVRHGANTATLGFDEQALKVQTPPAGASTTPPGFPGGIQPTPTPISPNPNVDPNPRAPRRRVVLPPPKR